MAVSRGHVESATYALPSCQSLDFKELMFFSLPGQASLVWKAFYSMVEGRVFLSQPQSVAGASFRQIGSRIGTLRLC